MLESDNETNDPSNEVESGGGTNHSWVDTSRTLSFPSPDAPRPVCPCLHKDLLISIFFMHPPPPQHQGLTSTQVGEFAENFVHNRHFALLRSKLGNVLQHTDHIRVGSCCSGWGCLEMVLEELEPHWNDAHEGWQLKARLLEIILTPGLLNGISR